VPQLLRGRWWFAGGAHCWCRRHHQTIATPASGCAYWFPAKNAARIPVLGHDTMLSVNFNQVRSQLTAHEAEMQRQAQALITNGWKPDLREGRAVRSGDEPAGFIEPDVWKAMVAQVSDSAGPTMAGE
jgi:hypothetical protein